MQRYVSTTLMVLSFSLVILWVGCGGPTTEPTPGGEMPKGARPPGTEVPAEPGVLAVPSWFLNIPEDPNFFYATGTHASKDLQFAMDSAKNAGRVDITTQIETRVAGMFKRFREEIGVGEDAELEAMITAVSKEVFVESSKITKTLKQDVKKEGDIFRVYVLMEMSIGQANSFLLDKIKENKNMYTRFRATQGFKELEEEVEKYEQWRKEQQQG